MLRDNEATNKNVKFDTGCGNPVMHVSDKNGNIKIKCEYVGGATKDNAVIEGTAFKGRFKEKDGKIFLVGSILTAPIFHSVLFAAFFAFIIMFVISGVFSPIPFCALIFDFFMYKNECAKQDLIYRYIERAEKRSRAIVPTEIKKEL